jgi:tetratricopeptide (TPR) repeat protein
MSILGQQFSSPADWQAFERLCFALYGRIWGDPNAQMNGRSGQKQAGVDIYGHDREDRHTGVQCKGKNGGYGSKLTKQELRKEVQNAKGFKPPLDVFILATTAPNDVTLQTIAREITKEHRKQGLFEVHVTGWDTLQQRVVEFPEIARTHYAAVGYAAVLEEVQTGHGATMAALAAMEAKLIARLPTQSADAAPTGDQADEPLRARIKDAAELSNDGQSRAAIVVLQRIQSEEWEAASPRNRYRLLNALGFAFVGLEETSKGTALLRQAYDADPGKPWSLAALSFAEIFDGHPERGFDHACQALEADPTLEPAAVALLHAAPTTMAYEDVRRLVPDALLSNTQVLLGLSAAAHKRGEVEEALLKAEAAHAADPEDWRTRSTLAHELIAPILAREAIGLTRLLDEASKARFDRGLGLLRQAWEAIADGEAGARFPEIAVNLSSALEVAGDEAGSEAAVDAGLRGRPDYSPLLRRKAIILAARGDWAGSKPLLDRAPKAELEPEDRLLAARAMLELGDPTGARSAVEELLAVGVVDQIEGGAVALRLEIDVALGGGAEAVHAAWDAQPDSMVIRIAVLETAKCEEGLRSRLLADLDRIVPTLTDERDQAVAAVALRAVGEPGRAADLLRPLTPTDRDTPLVQERLKALLGADRRKEAREFFEELAPAVRTLTPYVDFGVRIYDRVGNLPKAREIVLDHLSRHPDDLRARLVWAGLSERMRDVGEIRTWLEGVSPAVQGSPHELMTLAHAIDRMLADGKAIEIGYRALRAGYDDPAMHLGYSFGLFLLGQASRSRGPGPTVVGPDTAVVLARTEGEGGFARIIETGPEPNLGRDEIASTDPLAKRLIGLPVGAEITLPDLIAGDVRYRVTEIKDKYLYAHFAALNGFHSRFPGNTAFASMTIDEAAPNPFEDMFRITREKGERGLDLEARYREGSLPLAIVAKASGSSLFDVWDDLSGRQGLPILCAAGLEGERDAVIRALGTARTCVMDPLSVYIAATLGISDALEASFPALAVTQSTIDLLANALDERLRDTGSDRRGTFGWNGSHYFMVEPTVQQLRARAARTEAALAFARRCRVVPAEGDAPLPAGAEQLMGLLSRAHQDSILAASNDNHILLCEDGPLRYFIESVVTVRATWIQPMLELGVADGRIDRSRYSDAVGRLVDAGHHFTSFGITELHRELKAHNWVPIGRVPEYFHLLAMPAKSRERANNLVALLLMVAHRATNGDHRFRAILWGLLNAFRQAQPGSLTDRCNEWLERRAALMESLSRKRPRRRLLEETYLHGHDGGFGPLTGPQQMHLQHLARLMEEFFRHCPNSPDATGKPCAKREVGTSDPS